MTLQTFSDTIFICQMIILIVKQYRKTLLSQILQSGKSGAHLLGTNWPALLVRVIVWHVNMTSENI